MILDAPRALPGLVRKDTKIERVAVLPFAGVYERHADAVYRFCLAQLGDAAAAEDVAAQTFENAYAAWPRLAETDPDGVRRWIFRIARNATIDHLRRGRRRALLLGRLGSNGHHARSIDVETVAAIRAELRDVLGALHGPRPRDRELVGMRVAAGLSYAEIAEVMGISEQAARTATHRALARVRETLEGTR
jgi:RNA polymerase sigma-70 factor (ECF subfamily)